MCVTCVWLSGEISLQILDLGEMSGRLIMRVEECLVSGGEIADLAMVLLALPNICDVVSVVVHVSVVVRLPPSGVGFENMVKELITVVRHLAVVPIGRSYRLLFSTDLLPLSIKYLNLLSRQTKVATEAFLQAGVRTKPIILQASSIP